MLTYADDFVATGADGLRNSLAYTFADVTVVNTGNEGSRQGAERIHIYVSSYYYICVLILLHLAGNEGSRQGSNTHYFALLVQKRSCWHMLTYDVC